MRGEHVRDWCLSRFKMQRIVLYPKACSLVREWNRCSLSSEFDQTKSDACCHNSRRLAWSLGVRQKGAGWQCVGVTSVTKQPGARACMFDLASAKLAGILFHGQNIAHGMHRRKQCLTTALMHPEKSSSIPSNHTNTRFVRDVQIQTHELTLICWAPHFLALGLERST